jgi:deazaflavin-dependent oxidoreductase (nitroreductase family)
MSSDEPFRSVSRADRFRWVWRIVNRLESLQVRHLGVSGISLLRCTPVLVLETTGRRTGRRRRAAVAYWTDGDVVLIGGGAAGMSRVDWVANLRSQQDCVAYVRRRGTCVRARELTGDEYCNARAEALRRWPHTSRYEEKSGRKIPYFSLTPTRPVDAAPVTDD